MLIFFAIAISIAIQHYVLNAKRIRSSLAFNGLQIIIIGALCFKYLFSPQMFELDKGAIAALVVCWIYFWQQLQKEPMQRVAELIKNEESNNG